MKQTAVEWFKNELIKRFKRSQSHQTDSEWSFDMIKKVSEIALEMEKQQIKDAFQYKFLHPYVENEPEQYYNETYKK